jgi:lipopolysaccharide/colanic/teichoic acid biosynthesis glycosyltransferase
MTTNGKFTNGNGATNTAMDRIIAAALLIYFAPLMVVVAFLIKFDSRGPVLDRSRRRDENGMLVHDLTFRTMTAARAPSGVASRVMDQYTPLGSFLRMSRLDQLPRLLITLRGEGSFAGLLR